MPASAPIFHIENWNTFMDSAFKNMSDIAGIQNVDIVNGYVLENQKKIQKRYSARKMPVIGHSWNRVELAGRKFFVDTTFMARGTIGNDEHRLNTFRHKREIKNRSRGRDYEINSNINHFYIDFTPQQELKRFQRLHVWEKYIQ